MRIARQTRIAQALQKTLLYSDIFDYPLTGDQLYQFSGIPLSGKDFLLVAKTLPHVIHENTIYYFLPKRKKIVAERIRRKKISLKKIRDMQSVIKILSIIPLIQLIGISGSLALLHADRQDDSDLFFITKKNTMWITRLLVYTFLQILGRKRKRKNNAHALCANMFLDESDLQITKEKQSLYTAHEIMQVVPIVNKNSTYEKFLISNKWVQKFFPNVLFPKKKKEKIELSLWFLIYPIEYLSRMTQLLYMKNKKTREIATATQIAFHPIDYEKIIMKAYERKSKRYGV